MSWLYGAAGSIIAFFGTLTICLGVWLPSRSNPVWPISVGRCFARWIVNTIHSCNHVYK